MKALILEGAGDKPRLAVKEVPTPTADRGKVIVEVAACGLCHHDVAVMGGTLRRGVREGVILGHEISGRVTETGPDVQGVSIGDRVVATLTQFCGQCDRCAAGQEYRCRNGAGIGHGINGGFAEYVLLPESSVVLVPESIELRDAVVLACPLGVAFGAVHKVAEVREGETVMVTGASGGLGVHAVQLAKRAGARVLAITGSPEKAERLEAEFGCEPILADELDFAEIALALTEDQGVDVVIDTVGSATFRSALRSMGQFGRMVLLGEVAGGRVELNLAEIIFRDATVKASSGANRNDIASAIELVENGGIRPFVTGQFALEEAAEAYQMMRARETFGRVVLTPA